MKFTKLMSESKSIKNSETPFHWHEGSENDRISKLKKISAEINFRWIFFRKVFADSYFTYLIVWKALGGVKSERGWRFQVIEILFKAVSTDIPWKNLIFHLCNPFSLKTFCVNNASPRSCAAIQNIHPHLHGAFNLTA